jgi:transcriptional regulator with XRE-family HTH domain
MEGTYGVHVSDDKGESPNTWALFLREHTSRPGWTIQRLADESNINRSTIFRWLKGDVKNLTMSSVRLVADALGVDMATALRAAGQLADERSVDEGDWEIRMIRESGLHPQVIERLISDALVRRERERINRREELERQIALLRSKE